MNHEEQPILLNESQGEETPQTHEEVAQESNPIAAVAGDFGLNGQIFIAQLINFLLVLVILWRFAYKPIVRMLDERSEKIAKSMRQAEEMEKRVSDIEQEREGIINAARKEAQDVMEAAHAKAQERQEEMIAAAKREVERVIAKGKEQLTQEKVSMVKEMRKDLVDIAVKAATRIVQNQVDEQKSKSLAEEAVRKLT